jgi:acyl-CoA reductase-like NAD-dependent aldehyde dehydrogenase
MNLPLKNALYINGQWLPGEADPIAVINPADESLLGLAPAASAAQTDYAIASARAAFDQGPWPQMSPQERMAVLQKFYDYLQSRRADIIELIIQEAGATRSLAEFLQFDIPMKHARQLMADALVIKPEMTPIEVSRAPDGSRVVGTSQVVYEPVGVVSAITAYNFPFFLNVVKLFHALPMGNTVILKPSPLTPFQALMFGEAAEAAGLPAGVLNIINGDIETGTQITSDVRVDMVTFTGSDKVGASIVMQAAPTLKKTHMELGGKSALIVRSDADIQQAAMAAVGNITIHAGQGCALTTRIMVNNAVREPFLAAVKTMMGHMKLGNPLDATTTMGPLIRANARARVEHYVAASLDQGGRLICGGQRPADLDKGFYYQPTLFDNLDNNSILAQEEVFGPVGIVLGFDTDAEAIAMANACDFGLSGGIFSKDAGAAYEMALQLRTGGVLINGGAGTMLSSSPFGGYKRSGFGREYGRQGLLDFTEIKTIAFHAG